MPAMYSDFINCVIQVNVTYQLLETNYFSSGSADTISPEICMEVTKLP